MKTVNHVLSLVPAWMKFYAIEPDGEQCFLMIGGGTKPDGAERTFICNQVGEPAFSVLNGCYRELTKEQAVAQIGENELLEVTGVEPEANNKN